jgi:uncharacterized coiled-coil protein SlyX
MINVTVKSALFTPTYAGCHDLKNQECHFSSCFDKTLMPLSPVFCNIVVQCIDKVICSFYLQARLERAEAQQAHQEALSSAMASISGKVELFRSQLHALTTDTRQQLSSVHSDQANTAKRILYRIQQARHLVSIFMQISMKRVACWLAGNSRRCLVICCDSKNLDDAVLRIV